MYHSWVASHVSEGDPRSAVFVQGEAEKIRQSVLHGCAQLPTTDAP